MTSPQNQPPVAPNNPADAAPASPLTWRYPFPAKDGKEINDPQLFYSALGVMSDGYFPLGVNGFPHGGVHFGAATASRVDQSKGIRAIADGDIVAYKLDDAYPHLHFTQTRRWASYSTGFVLIRHKMSMPRAPGSTGAQPADETLTFFSLYMHTADWSTYLSDGGLVRPGWWLGVDAFRIGRKDTQSGDGAAGAFVYTAPTAGKKKNQYIAGQKAGFLPEGSEITIGEKRGPWGHIESITAGSMISPKSGGYFGWEDGPQAPWLAPDGEGAKPPPEKGPVPSPIKVSDKPLTPEGDWGWVYLHDQQAVKEPTGVGTVVILPSSQPIHVKAGTLLGQPGEYLDYEISQVLPPRPARQLLHLEVFADETLRAFIEKSRARAAQLPKKDQTIFVIQAGAKLVAKPAVADLKLGAGAQLAKLTLTATSPKTGPWVQVQPWINDPSGKATQYQAPVWIARSNVSQLSSPNGLSAWTSFPLQLNQAASPVNADLVTYPRAELDSLGEGNVALDDKGMSWWRLDVGTGSGQSAIGWVCGAKPENGAVHPGTRWESPWAWPGFEIVDATGINLTDAFKRNLSVTGAANTKEQKAFAPSTAAVGNSALLQKLEQTVSRLPASGEKGKDGSEVVTAVKLQQALRTRWLASELGHVILKYESEWGGGMSRWEALTPLMRNAAENWKCELERIRKLQWWDSVRGKVEEFPTSPVVSHLHPIALVGNFFGSRPKISIPMLRKIWGSPSVSDDVLADLAAQINENVEAYKLDTEMRLSHFFAQVRTEVGALFRLVEVLDYSSGGLKGNFSYFASHPAEADLYGRSSQHPARQEEIANRAYNGVNGVTTLGNGPVSSGDGWKFRGRGLKQLTGRYNYTVFNSRYPSMWPEENVNFIQNPDLLGQMKYGVRSAVFFWLNSKLYDIADQANSNNGDQQVNKITSIINQYTNSYGERRAHYQEIMSQRVFKEIGE